MSDHELTALRRAHEAEPHNRRAKERLQDAWIRAGLGWHGETLPRARIRAGGSWYATLLTRNVYEAVLMPTDSIGAVSGAYDALVRIPLVYVPGGEVPCTACVRGHHGTFKGYKRCEVCDGMERVKIAPFYVGRFLVRWAEFRLFCDATESEALPVVSSFLNGLRAEHGNHPVVNVTHADALAFCAWAGLRLPTATEWRWAALGAPVPRGAEAERFDRHALEIRAGSPEDSEREFTTRRFPWGNDPPTAERCAAADPRYAPSRTPDRPSANGMFVTYDERRGSTAPVVEWLCPSLTSGGFVKPKHGNCVAESLKFPATEHTARCRLAPARPAGASWCGMQDAVGNVGQFTHDAWVCGSTFNEADVSCGKDALVLADACEDVGFRVALSAET